MTAKQSPKSIELKIPKLGIFGTFLKYFGSAFLGLFVIWYLFLDK